MSCRGSGTRRGCESCDDRARNPEHPAGRGPPAAGPGAIQFTPTPPPGRSPAMSDRSVLRAEPLDDRCLPSGFEGAPVVPVIDGVMQAHLRDVAARGRALGNREDVFAKVGDSNTGFPEFL